MRTNVHPKERGFTDLVVAFILLITSVVALPVQGTPTLLAILLGIPFLLFLPGYAIVAALFPSIPGGKSNIAEYPSGPGWGARGALSLLSSAVVLAIVGFLLSRWEVLHLYQIIAAVGGLSTIGLAVAFIRRRRIPIGQRADPLAAYIDERKRSRRKLDLKSGLMMVAILALIGSLAFTGVIAGPTESYTEVYLVPQGPGADSVTGIGTSTLETGEETSIELAIENHERVSMNYTVFLTMEHTDINGTTTQNTSADSYQIGIDSGETITTPSSITAPESEGAVRLEFLIYKGDVSGQPNATNADITLRYWLTIVEERPE